MSMPNIPDITPNIELDRDEAVTMLLASIALEEMGLAHILNAEGEKLQHVLGLHTKKNVCSNEILAINNSVEKVIKSVTRLQLILQEKLENVLGLIPKEDSPCRPVYPKLSCCLKGCGVGYITNRNDPFYGALATLDASEIDNRGFPLKYKVFKRDSQTNISLIIAPIRKGLQVKCKISDTCPTPERPNTFVMSGKAVMSVTSSVENTQQATVNFILKLWDYGLKTKFEMQTWLENSPIFTHNSGLIDLNQGTIRIEEEEDCNN